MTMKEFIKNIQTSPLAKTMIPLGYGPGLPIISRVKGEVLVRIPFFKETFKPDDGTLVYPVRYLISALWKNGKIIEAKDLIYTVAFQRVDPNRPIGTFRHEAVSNMTKKEYFDEKDALYACYDKMIAAMEKKASYTEQDAIEFVKKLNVIIEPSLKPFYYAIDKNFSGKFIKIKK